jgi:hypothetical protein
MVQNLARIPVVSTALLFVVMAERPAEAYIDPGTASYVFQLIAGALLGAVFLLRTYWNQVTTTLRGLVSRDVARDR